MTTSEPWTVGVLIVDDDPLVRAGLMMMLGGAPDIRVVADAGHDRRRTRARDRLALLNDRQREVAVAVGQGRSNAQIGAVLHLSVPTVKTHVSSILTKLDLNNRVQIALLAHDAGFLDGQE
jgi:DNA-binding NarL/FixJ family response regulator